MDTVETIKELCGLDGRAAYVLSSRAEARVRAYLNYGPTEPVDRFFSVIVDVAELLNKKQTAISALEESGIGAGVQSKTWTEGKVSVKEDYGQSGGSYAGLIASYDTAIQGVLDGLKPYRRASVHHTEGRTPYAMEAYERRFR